MGSAGYSPRNMEFPSLAFLVVSCIFEGALGYDTYTVERDCLFGNLSIQLSAVGPGSALLMRTTDRTSYSVSGECRIELRAPTQNHRIVVSIRQAEFRRKGETCQDFIQIEKPMCSKVYSMEEGHHFTSRGDTLEILHYVSDIGIDNSTLTGCPGAKVTVTTLTQESEKCPEDWFRCRNGFCIWSGLRCDSHNNCGDRSDEQDCGSSGGSQSTALIILAILILLLLLLMCAATLLCSKNETVRRFSNRLRSRTLSYLPRFSK